MLCNAHNDSLKLLLRSKYDDIIDKIADVGLWDLVSLSETNAPGSDKICQAIKVICEDGTVYSYYTEDVPDSKFAKIVSILSAYCTFPAKIECRLPYVDFEEEKPTENKNGDWFKPAGDL